MKAVFWKRLKLLYNIGSLLPDCGLPVKTGSYKIGHPYGIGKRDQLNQEEVYGSQPT